MRLLVTGGAGYIGSVVAAQLLEAGHQVVVLDDLSTGHADAVPAGAGFVRGTIRDEAAGVLAGGIDAVLHFAAKSLVGESVAEPGRYWSANLGSTLALLEAMRAAAVGSIVFSSTAAVYGEPEHIPVTETDPVRPANPYGATKAAVDEVLHEYARLHGLAAMSLRYFNVAGAYRAADGRWLAERHSPETHLIPTVLQVAWAVAGPAVPPPLSSRSSATTTRRRTGPACAITFTWPTSAGRTCSRSAPARPASTGCTTSATAPGSPTARCSPCAAR